MSGPDPYDMDDQLMDELGGAMDDYDVKKVHPIVSIEICLHPGGKPEDQAEPDGDEAMPTPEEMEELEKAIG